MPSGYTANIEDKSFEEFILECARNFGQMRRFNESYDPIEPESYYKNNVENYKEQLERYQNLSIEKAYQMAKEQREKRVQEYKEAIKDNKRLQIEYEQMLKKVKRWEPPTEDHDGIKEFMINQLEDSIDHDCDNSFYIQRLNEIKQEGEPSGERYKNLLIQITKEDIERSKELYQKEVERTKNANEWIKQLKESLDGT